MARRARPPLAVLLSSILAAGCASPLVRADGAWDRGDFDEAAAGYDEALRGGVPEERRGEVAERLAAARARAAEVREAAERALPADWIVTIHGAVVLPFKPVEKATWDGPGDVPVPQAEGFLGMLAREIHAAGPSMVRAAEAVLRWTGEAVEAPDCYVLVSVDGAAFGGPDLEDRDDFLPAWDLRIPLRGSPADGRVLSLRVRDADLTDDDNVGAWQTTVGEVLSRPGVREIVFVDREGRTEAGGIVAIRISVERAASVP